MTCKVCYGIATRDTYGLLHCRSCGAYHLLPTTSYASREAKRIIVRAKGALSIGNPTQRAKLKFQSIDGN